MLVDGVTKTNDKVGRSFLLRLSYANGDPELSQSPVGSMSMLFVAGLLLRKWRRGIEAE